MMSLTAGVEAKHSKSGFRCHCCLSDGIAPAAQATVATRRQIEVGITSRFINNFMCRRRVLSLIRHMCQRCYCPEHQRDTPRRKDVASFQKPRPFSTRTADWPQGRR